MSLTDILDAASKQHTSRVAITSKGESLLYGDLQSALNHIDSELAYLAGARVAVLLTDSLGCALFYIYLFRQGGCAIPISARATATQIESILDRAKPHYVLTSDAFYKRHRQVLAKYDCIEIGAVQSAMPTFSPRPGVAGIARKAFDDAPDFARDDIRTLMFTSGSTGPPKGVCLSETNVLSAAGMMAEFLGFNPDRRTLVTPPLYDYYGYIQFFAHALAGAGYILGESAAFSGSLFSAGESAAATDLAIVPYSLRQLVEVAEKKSPTFFKALSCVTSSSDVLSDALLKRLFALGPHLVVYDIYGLTEAGRAASRKITADTPASSSIGFPSRDVEFRIGGTKEQPSEIMIRGPNVAGFLRGIVDGRMEVTPSEWISTGDLGYAEESGEVFLVGRSDHMLNVMGEKLHPIVIESIAMTHTSVDDALAGSATDNNGSIHVFLDVVCDDLEQCIGELKSLMRAQLPRAFIPREIRAVTQIKRTDIGSKVKRGSAAS